MNNTQFNIEAYPHSAKLRVATRELISSGMYSLRSIADSLDIKEITLKRIVYDKHDRTFYYESGQKLYEFVCGVLRDEFGIHEASKLSNSAAFDLLITKVNDRGAS